MTNGIRKVWGNLTLSTLWGQAPRNPCKISLLAFWRAVGLWGMGGKAALPFLAETIGGMVGGCA